MRPRGKCPRRSPARSRPAPAPPPQAAFAAARRPARASRGSRALGELVEVRAPLLPVGVAALLRFLGSIEEEVGVVRQLLNAGDPVLVGVEARLDEPQCERR